MCFYNKPLINILSEALVKPQLGYRLDLDHFVRPHKRKVQKSSVEDPGVQWNMQSAFQQLCTSSFPSLKIIVVYRLNILISVYLVKGWVGLFWNSEKNMI